MPGSRAHWLPSSPVRVPDLVAEGPEAIHHVLAAAKDGLEDCLGVLARRKVEALRRAVIELRQVIGLAIGLPGLVENAFAYRL